MPNPESVFDLMNDIESSSGEDSLHDEAKMMGKLNVVLHQMRFFLSKCIFNTWNVWKEKQSYKT